MNIFPAPLGSHDLTADTFFRLLNYNKHFLSKGLFAVVRPPEPLWRPKPSALVRKQWAVRHPSKFCAGVSRTPPDF